jgi:recombinational DNA repair protein RecT
MEVAKIMSPQTEEKFVAIFKGLHNTSPEIAKSKFEVEKFNFLRTLDESNLSDCTPISTIGCFLEVISNGLTFNKSSKQVYLIPRNVKKGDGWEKRLGYQFTADALIFLAVGAGSIKHVAKPTIVYKGDEISVKTVNNQLTINHGAAIPRVSNDIIGGFTFVTHNDGSIEPFWFPIDEIERLKVYSAKANKGTANALYSSDNGQIDAGFFATKLIKSALKNVRKKDVSMIHVYDDEIEDVEMMNEDNFETQVAETMTVESDLQNQEF